MVTPPTGRYGHKPQTTQWSEPQLPAWYSCQKGGFQKGGNRNEGTKTGLRPPKPERGYKKRSDGAKKQEQGTFDKIALLQKLFRSRILTSLSFNYGTKNQPKVFKETLEREGKRSIPQPILLSEACLSHGRREPATRAPWKSQKAKTPSLWSLLPTKRFHLATEVSKTKRQTKHFNQATSLSHWFA